MRCDQCHGSGLCDLDGMPCAECNGSGIVSCCEGAENVKCYCADDGFVPVQKLTAEQLKERGYD